uniref:DUF4390 domain-containing protein n=1 Tax=Fervidobacterium pennivorans TaxID=93466 RepID=A0A7V4NH83_FERPE
MFKCKKIFLAVGIIVFLFTLFTSSVYAQNTSQLPQTKTSDDGMSVYGFIEKLAGNRNFNITTVLTFDVMDGQQHKRIAFSFDMVVKNLEKFTFYLKSPEVVKDIVIRYDIISRKVEYIYKNYKTTENVVPNVSQIGDILTSITDFLSTPLFNATYERDYIEFRPKNAAILARFGVQAITVRLYMEMELPKKIEILNDKTDEKVVLEFTKFVIG